LHLLVRGYVLRIFREASATENGTPFRGASAIVDQTRGAIAIEDGTPIRGERVQLRDQE
jgi:hypothetical protein